MPHMPMTPIGRAAPDRGAAVRIRAARPADAPAIAALVNGFAAGGTMLPRTAEQVSLAVESYVVAADARDRVLGCGALHEYSPSAAEVAAIAVTAAAQGHGLGERLVRAVEDLARVRGHGEAFLVTVRPGIFQRLGYRIVPAPRFPEKQCPHARPLATCTRCEKYCLWRRLRGRGAMRAA